MTFFLARNRVAMKVNPIGHSADFLKRKARSLKKEQGVSHTEALNLVAKDHGFFDWKSFLKQGQTEPRPARIERRPTAPQPAALDYYNTWTGKVIGQRPNARMSRKRHSRVGNLLQDVRAEVEYYKRAKNYLQDIIGILDTWLGYEYNESEMGNEEFNRMYYSKSMRFPDEAMPSQKVQTALKRKLREAKRIINLSYHDCKPLRKLHEKFLLAEKALEKWPKNIKTPRTEQLKGQIKCGKFVRLDDSKRVGVVFNHDTRTQVVEGYSDAGPFHYGRHEVTLLRRQPDIAYFKPMRLYLPYGKWICADGREVLFNRDYCPIWEKSPDGIVTSIAPDTHVHYKTSEHFYDDGSVSPYSKKSGTLEICLAVLKDWGVLERFPATVELLPKAIAARNMEMLSPNGLS